jgi:xylulokinase
MRHAGLANVRQVRISGGGARSPLWRQILADVLEIELVTVNTTEGAAYGAGLLAGVGAGVWPDVDAACGATVAITGHVIPGLEQSKRYQTLYAQYRALYPALAPSFRGLAEWVAMGTDVS